MNIVQKTLDELIPYENNPRHNDDAVDYVAESIKEFGFKVPIIIDKDNVIVAGHTRYKASKKLGIKEVPCLVADDLTDEQIKAFRLADNKVAEIATWDFEKLDLELSTLDMDMELFGFEPYEDTEPQEVVEDEFEVEVPEEPKAKYGDIYQLGKHRLMCGDSTSIDDVEKLMNGDKADMVFTDPPYNVAYEGGSKKREMIKNDKINNFYDFLYDTYKNCFEVMKSGAPIYVCHSELERVNFTKAFMDVGFKTSSIIIWAKNNSTFSMNKDYKQKHEPIIYGWKQGNNHVWEGGNCEDTLWEINRPVKSDLHPTMKPIELVARAVENSSVVGSLCYEPFGGSGSTLIACEQLNRAAYLMELDPKYVDVIINRWEQFTGKKAVLLNENDNEDIKTA